MAFDEIRLDLGIDYGTQASTEFSTSIITDGGGGEQRNVNWFSSEGRFSIGERSLTKIELDYFIEFHKARKGRKRAFRFKDWADYKAKSQIIGVGNGDVTQFQCFKTYSEDTYFILRPISKIVSGTVKVYFDGAEQASGWTINNNTGVITFATAPANGTIITADFEFDVPVRFEQDSIGFRFEAYDGFDSIFALEQLSLVEVRVTPTIAVSLTPVPQSISSTLNLGVDYGTVGGPQFNTSIYAAGANFETRVSNWDESKGRWNIGERSLTRSELDYFISFFRVVRGAGVGFYFYDWQTQITIPVRFESDSIGFRFDAFDPITEEAIFYLAGVNVVQIGCSLEELLFSVTSTFTVDFDYPPDGAYSFLIEAPSSLDEYEDCKIKAFLVSGNWDNTVVLGYFFRVGLGSFSGSELIGIGKKSYLAFVNQYENGPCYFSGTIQWFVYE